MSYKIHNCQIKRLLHRLWNLSPRLEQRTLARYKFHDFYSINIRVTRSKMSGQMEIQNAREGNKCYENLVRILVCQRLIKRPKHIWEIIQEMFFKWGCENYIKICQVRVEFKYFLERYWNFGLHGTYSTLINLHILKSSLFFP